MSTDNNEEISEIIGQLTEEREKIATAFRSIAWMAFRYANGRRTTAPMTVREAVRRFQEVYPDWVPEADQTLRSDRLRHSAEAHGGGSLDDDWLDDLVTRTTDAPG